MRAYTIVIFILAIHAGLAMINVGHITDIYGFNTTLDTSTHGAIIVVNNGTHIDVPSSAYFDENASNSQNITNMSNLVTSNDFFSGAIESIIGLAGTFGKLITTFSTIVFSIHALCAPVFGDFNSWVLEGMVDFVLGIALFQMVTGRSFKTME